jgi:hypothetical protein
MNSIDLSGHFPMPPGATAPKFHLKQHVRTEWIWDDELNPERYGTIVRIEGYITGAEWCRYCTGDYWTYWVLQARTPFEGELYTSIEIAEDELEEVMP